MPNLFALFRLAPPAQLAPPVDESSLLLTDVFAAGDDEPLLLTDFADPEPPVVAVGG